MKLKRAPQFFKAKEIDRENHRIYFVFSTPTEDRHGEVIDQRGWRVENYLNNPVVLWGHDQRLFPVGKTEGLGYDDEGNLGGWVKFAYDENPDAKICFELCAGGYLNAGSVGFMNLRWMYDEETDTLTLLENELYEFSIVNVPANPEALRKMVTKMAEDNVDDEVVEGVKSLIKSGKGNEDDRFKNLGEKIEKTEEADDTTDDDGTEDDGVDAETEMTAEKAVEFLISCSATDIKGAIETLTSKMTDDEKPDDAGDESKDVDDAVENTPDKDHSKKVRKGYSVHEINRVIRLLKSR